RWFDEIYNDWWHPAGSIMQGAGSQKSISLANCTTISLGCNSDKEEWDNLESIIKNTGYTVAKTAAFRQGLGVDFSRLRPKGLSVNNSSNESSGATHWMKFIDSLGYYVGQKGRIPAMLFSLSISHPDIEEFINIKSDYTKIQNANISVQITNDFYKAVENNEEWELFFEIPQIICGQRIYIDIHSIDKDSLIDKDGKYYNIAKISRKKEIIKKKVKAIYLLEIIAKNMCKHAEPGIQNIDIARKYSNSDYLKTDVTYCPSILSTNACSEQYLSRESLCVLSSINCERFSSIKDEYEIELEKIGTSVNRFLDNVNECELVYNTYATPHQKIAIEKLRRTGAGYTNIAGWLFKLNLEYGSEDGNKEIEKFTERYNYYLYKSSISLGKEKGNFGLFDQEDFEKSPFIKRMIKLGLSFETMRNVTCSSIAPTGTLSLMFRNLVMSYGIEPGFGIYFWKRTRMSGKYEYYFNVPRVVRDTFEKAGFRIPMDSDTIKDSWDGKYGKQIAEFIDKNKEKVGINFIPSTEINPLKKLDLMSKVMRWIDSSISVTYLLPEKSSWKDVYNFIIEAHKKEVKSIAAFPDRKMYGIVSFIPFKELAFNLTKDGINIHNQNFSDKEIEELNISRENIELNSKNYPKRLETLPCDINTVNVKGEKFIIVLGLQNGQPYEIFGGHLNGLNIKSDIKNGKITKHGKGKYSLELEEITIDDFSKQFTPTEQILFRMTSLMLRSGIPIHFIIEQLSKATDDITSISAAAIRILKRYIKDGQKILGKECPNCKNPSLSYQDGCVSCPCGWAKC
ncbi:MAG: hypothetical protein AABY22_14825, partial [Nanoarchaeota archaeon]